MDFIDKIRKKLNFQSKKALAQALGKDPQGFYSLERAVDRISLKDLVALRKLPGMTDKELLDLLEEESKTEVKMLRRPASHKSSEK